MCVCVCVRGGAVQDVVGGSGGGGWSGSMCTAWILRLVSSQHTERGLLSIPSYLCHQSVESLPDGLRGPLTVPNAGMWQRLHSVLRKQLGTKYCNIPLLIFKHRQSTWNHIRKPSFFVLPVWPTKRKISALEFVETTNQSPPELRDLWLHSFYISFWFCDPAHLIYELWRDR